MINLERKSGPWTLRVWGLILNFFGNALLVYGALGVVRDGSRLPLLIAGGILTLTCILVLAIPDRRPSGQSAERIEKEERKDAREKNSHAE